MSESLIDKYLFDNFYYRHNRPIRTPTLAFPYLELDDTEFIKIVTRMAKSQTHKYIMMGEGIDEFVQRCVQLKINLNG